MFYFPRIWIKFGVSSRGRFILCALNALTMDALHPLQEKGSTHVPSRLVGQLRELVQSKLPNIVELSSMHRPIVRNAHLSRQTSPRRPASFHRSQRTHWSKQLTWTNLVGKHVHWRFNLAVRSLSPWSCSLAVHAGESIGIVVPSRPGLILSTRRDVGSTPAARGDNKSRIWDRSASECPWDARHDEESVAASDL